MRNAALSIFNLSANDAKAGYTTISIFLGPSESHRAQNEPLLLDGVGVLFSRRGFLKGKFSLLYILYTLVYTCSRTGSSMQTGKKIQTNERLASRVTISHR